MDSTKWKDDTPPSTIVRISQRIMREMVAGKTKKRKIYRLCGQSGSGKTTQLLPAVERVCEIENQKPVIVAVRKFAKLHPKYEDIVKKYGKCEIREKTNGFALKCLCVTLKKILESGFLIILDMTLLDSVFEQWLLEVEKINNYEVNYQIIAVNEKISNAFIEKRKNNLYSEEKGKVVEKKSKKFFNQVLIKSIKYLIKKDGESLCVLWSVYDKNPVYIGELSKVEKIFLQTRKEIKNLSYSERFLLVSKINFMINL